MNSEPNETKKLASIPQVAAQQPLYYDLGIESSGAGSQEFNIRDILVMLFKYKYKILSVFLLTILAAFIIYEITPVRYEATSVLMLRYGREYATPNVSGDPSPLRIGLAEILNSEVAILSSKDLKETVIGKIGVDRLVPKASAFSARLIDPTQVALISMEKDLVVLPSKNSNLISVSYRSQDPRLAADVVNTLINNYQEKRLQVLSDPKPTLFLENKVASFYNRLRDSEQKLESFKQTNRVYAFEDQRAGLLHTREELNASASACQTQIKELHEKLTVLGNEAKEIAKVLPDSSGPEVRDEAEGQLLTLKRKEQELLSKYKEGNPLLANVRLEMKVVEDFMAKRKKNPKLLTNSISQELQKEIITAKADLASQEVRLTQQKQQLESLDKEIQALDLQENYVRDLRRELSSSEQMYEAYSKRLEEARITDDMDRQKMTSINIVEKASVPIAPVSPSKPLGFFLALSAVAGLGGGIVIAFLLESLGQGLMSAQKAEKRLNLPVLLVIPKDRDLIDKDTNVAQLTALPVSKNPQLMQPEL
ncbi:MAG: hypothetical protein ABSE08_10010 [Syntrophobacteraceae bacterium]|jgi:uncharacterized protein involved in exopolysaccharide biosynthesis